MLGYDPYVQKKTETDTYFKIENKQKQNTITQHIVIL